MQSVLYNKFYGSRFINHKQCNINYALIINTLGYHNRKQPLTPYPAKPKNLLSAVVSLVSDHSGIRQR